MKVVNRVSRNSNTFLPKGNKPLSVFRRSLYVIVCFAMLMILFTAAPHFAAGADLDWTKEELAFLETHPVIRIGVDPKFVPFEFIDENGDYKGITADYLALIEKRTGLRFEVAKDLTWPEAYDLALAGNLDALPALNKTSEREQYFLFSEPYYYFKRVIVTRDTDTNISGLDDLEHMTVAVQRNSSHHSYLLSYTGINLSLYDSVETALAEVATGSEKAFVGNLATSNYLIRSNGLTNLRFVSFEAEKQQALYFAVRKDWPELVSIFNKAMKTITDTEKQTINQTWIDLEADYDFGPMMRMVGFVGAFLAVGMGVSFFWISRLRKEIRQRRLIQRDLEKAKREADEANEYKSVFMARMSHEIRTPLNAITGMAYLLKKSSLTLTQKMYVDRIAQASSNMLSIINDILDYSKIEAGKVELEVVSFRMDQVIQDVVNIVSYKIDEQKIGFRLNKDPLIPGWFIGDSKRIEQILLNVLNNAAKFTKTGEVSLDIRLTAKENDTYHLSFTIRDTGIGMDEEQVKKLFAPFSQGDSSINRRFGGSGLGLSIVKNLLDMMNGHIQVFSTPGEGSTFIIHLPLTIDKETEDGYIKSLSGDHFKHIRTLVLEKSGANMNLIEGYLRTFGMHCELTSSTASALSILESADGNFAKPFDLVIVDYETPEEGGFEFAKAIRNSKKIVYQPKLIMLLPLMREDLFDQLNEYEVDIGIGKPIIPSILFNGILDIFKLKAVSASQPTKSDPIVHENPEKPCTILVVEDNKTNQYIAKSLLMQVGIESILASDGKEAVELFHRYQEKIDLILMDLHMPVMNGYEASEEIRKCSPTVPIVAMTADVILGVKEKCAQSGIHHYISKPFDPDEFLKTIKKILEEKHATGRDRKILNRTEGLKSMGGNADLYEKVLAEYSNENRNTLETLSHAIDEKRYSDAAQIVHKVKSSSGSIGAKPVYELCKDMQKALDGKKEEEIAFLHQKFRDTMRKLLEEIAV